MYQQVFPVVTDVRVSYSAFTALALSVVSIGCISRFGYWRASAKMATAQKAGSKQIAGEALNWRRYTTLALLALSGVFVLIITTAPTVNKVLQPFVQLFRGQGRTYDFGENRIELGLIILILFIVMLVGAVAKFQALSTGKVLFFGFGFYVAALAFPPIMEVLRFIMSGFYWVLGLFDSVLGKPGSVAAMASVVAVVAVVDFIGDLISRFATAITGRVSLAATMIAGIGAFFVIVQIPFIGSVFNPIAKGIVSLGNTEINLNQSRIFLSFLALIVVGLIVASIFFKSSGLTVGGLVMLGLFVYLASFVWSPAESLMLWSQSFVYGVMGALNSALTGVPA